MRISFQATAFACALVTLLAGGCAMLGGGESGDTRPPTSSAPASGSTVRGTVSAVDPQARTLTLSADTSVQQQSLRNDGGPQVLAYDTSTTVHYQGRTYRPEDLEPGDRIEATVERSGERLVARRIDVLSDVSAGGQAPRSVPERLDATVRWVDARNRTIELEPHSGDRGAVIAAYDANTRVEYQGRSYRPEDLERGDVVQVRTRMEAGRVVADEIDVIRDSRGAAAGTSQPPAANRALVRGRILQIDRNAQRIALESTSWAQGFDERAGTDAARSIAYDAQTIVEYQGKRYGVGNLEPGDEVEIEVGRRGSDYRAERIVVTRG
jgi:hypothetical protein